MDRRESHRIIVPVVTIYYIAFSDTLGGGRIAPPLPPVGGPMKYDTREWRGSILASPRVSLYISPSDQTIPTGQCEYTSPIDLKVFRAVLVGQPRHRQRTVRHRRPSAPSCC